MAEGRQGVHRSADAEQNRVYWDLSSPEYDERAGEFIAEGWAWGLWQVSEDELGLLDDVEGKDALELGCGAAEWSRSLARRGARPVGLDNSPVRIARAAEECEAAEIEFPLVTASAERIPLPDDAFDIVFCDWGAMTFADPYALVPEVSRVLRQGGIFVFSGATPLCWVAYDEGEDAFVERLEVGYFGMHRWVTPEGSVEFNLTIGDWIRLYRDNDFVIEDLIEIQPEEGAKSAYRTEAETAWARRWPMEQIWKVRRL